MSFLVMACPAAASCKNNSMSEMPSNKLTVLAMYVSPKQRVWGKQSAHAQSCNWIWPIHTWKCASIESTLHVPGLLLASLYPAIQKGSRDVKEAGSKKMIG